MIIRFFALLLDEMLVFRKKKKLIKMSTFYKEKQTFETCFRIKKKKFELYFNDFPAIFPFDFFQFINF